jgi:hypothetical protein
MGQRRYFAVWLPKLDVMTIEQAFGSGDSSVVVGADQGLAAQKVIFAVEDIGSVFGHVMASCGSVTELSVTDRWRRPRGDGLVFHVRSSTNWSILTTSRKISEERIRWNRRTTATTNTVADDALAQKRRASARPNGPRNFQKGSGLLCRASLTEEHMNRLAQGPLLVASFVALVATVEPAAAGRYCLQGKQWGYPGNCQFSSYRQCLASASGTDSGCGINPRYAYGRQRRYVPPR